MIPRLLGLLLSAVTLIAIKSADAQKAHRAVTDERRCKECTIETQLLTTLRPKEATQRLTLPPTAVVVNSRGEFIVARAEEGPPLVFDRFGNPIHTVGGVDMRPGIFTAASDVKVGIGDTLFVLDRASGSISVFAPDYRFIRSVPGAPGSFSFALSTPNHAMVVSATVPDAERFGFPLHALDARGNYRTSFGEKMGVVMPGTMYPELRWLASSRAGGVWSVTVIGQHLIEHWSADGFLQRGLVREASWFNTGEALQRGFTREKPRSPMNISIAEDPVGQLWIVSAVADSRWRKGLTWRAVEPSDESTEAPILHDYDLLNDGIIEVIEPKSASLIAARRFDEMWFSFVSPSLICRFVRDRNGHSSIEVHRLVLKRPERR